VKLIREMWAKTKAKLATSRSGRVVLHLATLTRDHRWLWHLAGMFRELSLKHC